MGRAGQPTGRFKGGELRSSVPPPSLLFRTEGNAFSSPFGPWTSAPNLTFVLLVYGGVKKALALAIFAETLREPPRASSATLLLLSKLETLAGLGRLNGNASVVTGRTLQEPSSLRCTLRESNPSAERETSTPPSSASSVMTPSIASTCVSLPTLDNNFVSFSAIDVKSESRRRGRFDVISCSHEELSCDDFGFIEVRKSPWS